MPASPSQKSELPPPRIDLSTNPVAVLTGFALILLFTFIYWYFFQRPFPVDSAIPHYAKVENVSGKLVSVGSDTLEHVMILYSQGFKEQYPGVTIQIEAKGSETAPPALLEGTSQLAPMSQPMTEEQIGAFQSKYDYKPTFYKIALDALAIYVNKDNPIRGITLQQVDGVFSGTFKRGGTSLETWGSLGLTGDWANKAITLYGRDKVSGTHAFFKQHALLNGDFKTALHEQISQDVVERVADEPSAIGYSGIGWKTSQVRALSIGETPGTLIKPTYKNALDGTYPLARFLYIYVNQKPGQPLDRLTGEFIKYALSREGQEAVVQAHFFPLPAQIVVDTLSGKN